MLRTSLGTTDCLGVVRDSPSLPSITLPDWCWRAGQASGASVTEIIFEPGWRWSDCIRPVVGGESCQVRHVGTLLAGELEILHDDGSKAHLVAGNAWMIEPGHDAWVVGDEPVVGLEFETLAAETYAKG